MDSLIENFIALDFETANQYRTSACSVGMVVVENREIKKEMYSLLKPNPSFFSYRNTAVHGITARDVIKAPAFEEWWSSVAHYFDTTDAIVAHNAPFDTSVLRACLENADIAAYLPSSACTYRQAKKLLPFLPNHQLHTVSNYFDIALCHHDAMSDARAAALIQLKLQQL